MLPHQSTSLTDATARLAALGCQEGHAYDATGDELVEIEQTEDEREAVCRLTEKTTLERD